MEETAACRSTWELEVSARHHIAYLADKRRACSSIDRGAEGSAHLATQLRHRLGLGLIQAGHALAGSDAVRGLATPPARAATAEFPPAGVG